MSDDLELRIKLWNHLSHHRNLMLSDAWYGTEKQVEGWTSISKLEREDPNSNANRELTHLEKIMHDPEFEKLVNGKFCMLFDLGAGDGYKGAQMLHWLSENQPALTYHVPYDSSKLLLNKAIDEIVGHWEGVYFLSGDPCFEVARFVENASRGRFQDCIRDLQEYLKLPDIIDSILNDEDFISVFRSSQPVGTDTLSDPEYELIKEASSTVHFKAEQLRSELEELCEMQNRTKIQKKLLEMRKQYNPELLQEFNIVLKAFNQDMGSYISWLLLTLSDAKLIKPSELTEHIGIGGEVWSITNPVISSGLRADFLQNQCNEIAYIRSNDASIKDFIINTAYSGEEHTREREVYNKINIKTTAIIALLGQTLGNFKPEQQAELLNNLYFAMKRQDLLILGVECRPEPDAPEYDSKIESLVSKYKGDAADGFLKETTRMLGIPDEAIGKLDARFRNNSVEMFYRVIAPEGITVQHPLEKETQIHFDQGKEILVASSYKFKPSELYKLLESARFKDVRLFEDRTDYLVVMARK